MVAQPNTSKWMPGSLVSARGRNWIVIPSEDEDTVLLRPLHGSDSEAAGIFTPLEPDVVTEASYPDPIPDKSGDFRGALLLKDAVRLTLRAGAGPFRSIGRLSVTPRPYQYVPLLMSLRLTPVRLLIADDVGVGKTIEAAMVARELLDRGIISRIGVLCPPHLCEQWAQELSEKFGIETAVIQPSRMARLERGLPRPDIHVFEHYPHIVASIDYVKSPRYMNSFVDYAPDLIIVDEAHSAARPRGDDRGTQQQRYRLLRQLASNPNRHIILTTATPHSGVEESFRSLLGILNEEFDLPVDENISRSKLLPHLVQRRRADLVNWLGSETPFPERDDQERTYRMTREFTELYESILRFCRQTVSDADGTRQRVRYWAAIAMLRCVLSSPSAAEATLSKRADRRRGDLEDSLTPEEFTTQVLDSVSDQDTPPDFAPTAAVDDGTAGLTNAEIRQLDGFLRSAKELRGPRKDAKLAALGQAVSEVLHEGYHPIVYCRFIDTAKYVGEQLQEMLSNDFSGLHIASVTGGDGNDEQRRQLVKDIVSSPVRLLVATDCLSEGINLQEHFDAVIHYDLPWNPNRLEQREGRVDRYGQKSARVKNILLWGEDNPIDRAVLRVLIKKAREIRQRLGISVSAAVESDAVVQAVVEDIFLQRGGYQLTFDVPAADAGISEYHQAVEEAAERESRNRAYFAQRSVQPDQVARELQELEPALGTAADIQSFVQNAIQRFNGELRPVDLDGVFDLHPGELQRTFGHRDDRLSFPMRVSFSDNPLTKATHIGRNHPVVAALSDLVIDRALNGDDPLFARCGAIVSDAIDRRTFVVLLRIRFLIEEGRTQQFAEEVMTAAFQSVSGRIEWLHPYQDKAMTLLSGNINRGGIPRGEARDHVATALRMLADEGDEWAADIVAERKAVLADSHERLRGMVRGARIRIRPHPKPDILGCYALVPQGVH